jgi:hypothetical protein
MGNKTSTSIYQKNSVLYVNKKDIDNLQENITSSTANTVMKIVQNASQNTGISQTINISNITADVFDVKNISNDIKLNLKFDSKQATEMQASIMNTAYQSMITAINNSTDLKTKQKLEANATTSDEEKKGFLAIPSLPKDVKTNITQINDIKTILQTNTHTKNIMKKAIALNFKSENVSNCLQQYSSSQTINLTNIHVKKLTIDNVRNEIVNTFTANCVQVGKMVSNTVNDLADTLGVRVVNDDKNTADQGSKGKGTTKKKTDSEGIFGGIKAITSMISNIFKGFGKMITMAIIAVIAIFVICLCSCSLSLGGGYIFNNYAQSDAGRETMGSLIQQYNSRHQ